MPKKTETWFYDIQNSIQNYPRIRHNFRRDIVEYFAKISAKTQERNRKNVKMITANPQK